jgi:hypothetical protein
MSKQLLNEELSKIQELNNEFNKLKMVIVDCEIQKHNALRHIDELRKEFSSQEKMLIDKYGKDAVINIQTGEVTQKEN